MTRRVLSACLLLASTPSLPGLAAQTPPATAPAFPTSVDLVVVDVVVKDEAGEPFGGLGREDFRASEDGVPQTIVSFEATELPAEAAPRAVPVRLPPVSSNSDAASRAARSFLVVFDDLHLEASNVQRAREAVSEFLGRGVREGDRVTLLATSGAVWWTARMQSGPEPLLGVLARLQGRLPDTSADHLSDYEALRIHVFRDTQVGERVRRRLRTLGVDVHDTLFRRRERGLDELPGVNHPYVEARAAQVYQDVRRRDRATLDVLRRALLSLAGAEGRKSMILVSEGFVRDPRLDEFRRVIDASRRANVAIYFLDARGLAGLPGLLSAEYEQPIAENDLAFAVQDRSQETEGSESLALDTGGFSVKNSNDLAAGIERIARESRTYYLLGYHSTNLRRDGAFRKIDVSVTRSGLRARARKGYYAPKQAERVAPAGQEALDSDLQRGLDAPFDMRDIPLRMTALVLEESSPGRAHVLIAADIDIRDLAFQERDGRSLDTLDLIVVAEHRDRSDSVRHDQTIEMNLLPQTRARTAQTGYSFQHAFHLPSGAYQARLVVRERNGGRLGTVLHDFEVPDLTGLRVSTPLLSDALQSAAGTQGPPRPAVAARRVFQAGSVLYVAFDVYGAARDEVGRTPRVTAGYVLRQADGTLHRRGEARPITPTASGQLSRLMGIPLEDAPPGDYELVLSVNDEVSGTIRELREPLTLVAPAASRATTGGR